MSETTAALDVFPNPLWFNEWRGHEILWCEHEREEKICILQHKKFEIWDLLA